MKVITEEEAEQLIEEAMQYGYIDYLKIDGGGYDYADCDLIYKGYEIIAFGIYRRESDGQCIEVSVTPEKYRDKIRKMFDLWLKI